MQMEISVILYNERPPETDIVCPVIALSLPLWSPVSAGGDISSQRQKEGVILCGPITARLVKPPSASHSSISSHSS